MLCNGWLLRSSVMAGYCGLLGFNCITLKRKGIVCHSETVHKSEASASVLIHLDVTEGKKVDYLLGTTEVFSLKPTVSGACIHDWFIFSTTTASLSLSFSRQIFVETSLSSRQTYVPTSLSSRQTYLPPVFKTDLPTSCLQDRPTYLPPVFKTDLPTSLLSSRQTYLPPVFKTDLPTSCLQDRPTYLPPVFKTDLSTSLSARQTYLPPVFKTDLAAYLHVFKTDLPTRALVLWLRLLC